MAAYKRSTASVKRLFHEQFTLTVGQSVTKLYTKTTSFHFKDFMDEFWQIRCFVYRQKQIWFHN